MEQDGRILKIPRNDLTGRVFGRLTVLRQAPDGISGGKRRQAWWCKCSCGNPEELWILGQSLVSGHTISCGCARKDACNHNNTYDLTGEYGICIMKDGNKFIFDIEDYDKIKNYNWHLSGREYIGSSLYVNEDGRKKKVTLMIHRLIMGIDDKSWKEVVVDHINGDVYDNRKSNLRITSQLNNMKNHKIPKNNKSGVSGVSFYKNNQKWCSNIICNGKSIFLGLYENFEDAVKARKEAEEKYFGEYSYDNSRGIKRQEEVQNDI